MILRTFLIVPAAALALVLAACGSGGGADDSPDAGGAGEPSPPAAAEWASCTNEVDGWTAEYPDDWHTNEGELIADCRLFDPEPVALDADDGTLPPDAAVQMWVNAILTDFEEFVDDPLVEERDRRQVTVDGRPGFRLEVEEREEGMVPAGTRSVRYVVDLGQRAFLAVSHDVGEPPFAQKVEALDAMMERIRFEPEEPLP
jgi:hypothetical protein